MTPPINGEGVPEINGHTPGDFKGDRYDGTVKYHATGADGRTVLAINDKSGDYGFTCQPADCNGDCYARHPADERLFFIAARAPHLCDIPNCPGPENLKRLQESPELRRLLWLTHGCEFLALYGDDGEMQCHFCRADFKRDPAELIERRLQERGEKRLQEGEELRQVVRDIADNPRVMALLERYAGALHDRVAALEDK